jgi:3-hydroxybutyryl-CoA dehydrogenase
VVATGPAGAGDGAPVRRLGVIGAGTMGHQIAMLGALAGCETVAADVREEALRQAEAANRGHMDRWVARGRLTTAAVDAAFARLRWTTRLEDAAADADVVIEAVIERLEEKREVFRALDAVAPARTVLATNSSTVRSSLLADATRRPDRVCNMHFFNPPLVMELVEVVMHPLTSQATADTVTGLVRQMGRTPVLLRKEMPGFVVNRILWALVDEAVRLYEAGVASVEDIDTAVKKGLRHPMGPFELMDFNGIDVAYHVRMQRQRETGDAGLGPPRSIVEKYERGEWGRKSGRGWYTYPRTPQ